MYPAVTNYLDFANSSLPSQEFIYIEEKNFENGSFLLYHFCSMFLKGNGNVLLINTSQTLQHYTHALQKLNTNVKEAGERFIFVDTLNMFNAVYENNDVCESLDAANPFADIDLDTFSFKSFFYHISTMIPKSSPSLVVIDDFSMFLNVGINYQLILDFVHYLKVLCAKYNVNVLTRCCNNNSSDEELTAVNDSLRNYCTMELNVSPLKTGYSKELTGQICMKRYKKCSVVLNKRVDYKLLDKDVKFIAPGTSSAVL